MSTSSRWLWPIILAASATGAWLVVWLPLSAPLRPAVALWFLLACPGMAFVRLLHLHDLLIQWTLAIALSLALDALVAGVMLYLGAWNPPIGLAVLAGLTLMGVVLQLLFSSNSVS